MLKNKVLFSQILDQIINFKKEESSLTKLRVNLKIVKSIIKCEDVIPEYMDAYSEKYLSHDHAYCETNFHMNVDMLVDK